MLSKKLLKVLCCPETKAPLVQIGDMLVSTDANSRRRYKIVDNIPILLIEQSVVLSKEEWEAAMLEHRKKGN